MRFTFTLPFRIISKKNSKQIVGRGRPFLISSKAYRAFEEEALWHIKANYKIPKLTPPYMASYDIRFKGKYRADLDNSKTSINDIMQKAGIIGNDKDIVENIPPTRFSNGYDSFLAIVTLWDSDELERISKLVDNFVDKLESGV